MKHAVPQPLKVAMDLVKKFSMDLAPRLTPEQRRDFARLQTVLEEADRFYTTQLGVQMQRNGASVAGALQPRGY
jgi:hypothetical protein